VKEKLMIRKQTTLHAARALALVVLGAAMLLGACAPGMTPAQIQALVQESVAQTVAAQNSMATSVAQTVAAMAPTSTATPLPTLRSLPTLTPLATVTPLVIPGGGGGGGGGGGSSSKAKYACEAWTVKPHDNEEFKPGDPFDIKWIITNVGSEDMRAGLDMEYLSGPQMTTKAGVELPLMEPGDTYTFTADANAPLEKGFWVMTWKVEGGLCYPYVAIISGKPGDP
jgi:hypothetical protein